MFIEALRKSYVNDNVKLHTIRQALFRMSVKLFIILRVKYNETIFENCCVNILILHAFNYQENTRRGEKEKERESVYQMRSLVSCFYVRKKDPIDITKR